MLMKGNFYIIYKKMLSTLDGYWIQFYLPKPLNIILRNCLTIDAEGILNN